MVELQPGEAGVDLIEQESFGPSPMAPIALVATTMSDRLMPSAFSAPPTNSSLWPLV